MASNKSWYTFWPKYADNSRPLDDVPAGQPKNNAEFDIMLLDDANPGSLFTAATSHYIEGGTQYWSAQLLDDLVQEKYTDLNVLSMVHKHEVDDPLHAFLTERSAEHESDNPQSQQENAMRARLHLECIGIPSGQLTLITRLH